MLRSATTVISAMLASVSGAGVALMIERAIDAGGAGLGYTITVFVIAALPGLAAVAWEKAFLDPVKDGVARIESELESIRQALDSDMHISRSMEASHTSVRHEGRGESVQPVDVRVRVVVGRKRR